MTNTSWWNQTSPTSLITRCCFNEWMYIMKMYQSLCTCLARTPLHSLNYDLYQTRMVIVHFDAWCCIMKNISLRIWATDMYCVITLILSIGIVQGSTDICLFLVQIQLKYRYIYCYPIITLQQLVVTLHYWTPFSAKTLGQRHLSTRLHSSPTPAEICSEWLLDLEQLLMANYKPCGFKGHWYLPM